MLNKETQAQEQVAPANNFPPPPPPPPAAAAPAAPAAAAAPAAPAAAAAPAAPAPAPAPAAPASNMTGGLLEQVRDGIKLRPTQAKKEEAKHRAGEEEDKDSEKDMENMSVKDITKWLGQQLGGGNNQNPETTSNNSTSKGKEKKYGSPAKPTALELIDITSFAKEVEEGKVNLEEKKAAFIKQLKELNITVISLNITNGYLAGLNNAYDSHCKEAMKRGEAPKPVKTFVIEKHQEHKSFIDTEVNRVIQKGWQDATIERKRKEIETQFSTTTERISYWKTIGAQLETKEDLDDKIQRDNVRLDNQKAKLNNLKACLSIIDAKLESKSQDVKQGSSSSSTASTVIVYKDGNEEIERLKRELGEANRQLQLLAQSTGKGVSSEELEAAKAKAQDALIKLELAQKEAEQERQRLEEEKRIAQEQVEQERQEAERKLAEERSLKEEAKKGLVENQQKIDQQKQLLESLSIRQRIANTGKALVYNLATVTAAYLLVGTYGATITLVVLCSVELYRFFKSSDDSFVDRINAERGNLQTTPQLSNNN